VFHIVEIIYRRRNGRQSSIRLFSPTSNSNRKGAVAMPMQRRMVLWGTLAVVALGGWNAVAQSGLVTILTPKPGSTVDEDTVEVGGTYSPKVAENIWVLVWPAKAPKRFWQQSDEADKGRPATKQDGKWSVQCSLGGPPQQYDIAVYTANRVASAELSQTLKKWAESGRFPGLTKLPEGLTEQARITIRRTK
jgi:hypothetical protein